MSEIKPGILVVGKGKLKGAKFKVLYKAVPAQLGDMKSHGAAWVCESYEHLPVIGNYGFSATVHEGERVLICGSALKPADEPAEVTA